MIDGCCGWGAVGRVAMPAGVPGLTALAILCWLYTWNEFLFALILTAHETPIVTVVMAQFVHELGMEWHLMSATAVIALRSEEHTSELQSLRHLVCRLLLEKKKNKKQKQENKI